MDNSLDIDRRLKQHAEQFFKLVRSPLKFRFFLFLKLPSAFFAGVRVKAIDTESCTVTVPFKWFSQNPFRSTYFACLSMAAELSTGALGLGFITGFDPGISMLVTQIEGSFMKKATGITSFICEDGAQIRQTIADAVQTGEGKSVRVRSVGKNKEGETVAEFFITWSFRVKSK